MHWLAVLQWYKLEGFGFCKPLSEPANSRNHDTIIVVGVALATQVTVDMIQSYLSIHRTANSLPTYFISPLHSSR